MDTIFKLNRAVDGETARRPRIFDDEGADALAGALELWEVLREPRERPDGRLCPRVGQSETGQGRVVTGNDHPLNCRLAVI